MNFQKRYLALVCTKMLSRPEAPARAALTLTGPRDPSAPKPLKMGLFYHILMLYRKLNQDHADMCILE